MVEPTPDPLPPDRDAVQKSHLHNKGTDALAKAVDASIPNTEEVPPEVRVRIGVRRPFPAEATKKS